MLHPVEVKPLDHYKIWIRFEDGVKGEIDLSHLAGKGIFRLWNDYDQFKKVHIAKHGELVWSKEVEICADNLYLQLTGKKAEQVFAVQQRERKSA